MIEKLDKKGVRIDVLTGVIINYLMTQPLKNEILKKNYKEKRR
jgi:hypothetical protein